MGVFLLLDTPYACTSQGKDRVLATRDDRSDRGDPHSGFSGSFMLAMAAGPLRSCSRIGRWLNHTPRVPGCPGTFNHPRSSAI